MGITPQGYFDWALLDQGPPQKTGYPGVSTSNPEGVVFHSAEGNAQVLANLVHDLNREASWTASNLKDGRFIQHYPVTRIVWTNGSKQANMKFRGIESEGMAGEPLTQAQTDNLIHCARDMRDFFGWPGFRRKAEAWEHNEMTAFGSAATACPSGRIPWDVIIPAVAQEDDMTEEQANQLKYIYDIMTGDEPAQNGKQRWAWMVDQIRAIKADVDAIKSSGTHTHDG